MKKIKKSYRLPEETISQIEVIMEKEKVKGSDEEQVSGSEIIAEAVHDYYFRKIDQQAGDPYFSRIESIIQTSLRKYMEAFINSLNGLRYTQQIQQELINFLLGSLELTENPDAIFKAMDAKSVYEDAAEKAVLKRMEKDNLEGN